ncbi:MAG: 23S rRNA (adenine(2503)-C(2))-methyltransferase RlmN [Ignavibacteriaceae bacterium]|nr:23S rRNA (adenine(2503)-C(2))-methyltransferase RlmN [Ignavibacteriaceae bacterium]
MNKKFIKGLSLAELKELCEEKGLPKFRSEQLFNWMYNYLVTDFDEMLNLPKDLRSQFNEEYILNTLELTDSKSSKYDNTRKLIFKTTSNHFIESVIIPDKNRVTLCVSTQVGCPLDCQFCATGLMGYKKNLTAGEIFDQYGNAQRISGNEITNIVYMGMGEPLLNFDNTVKSLSIFSEELTKGISLKKITVSTAGIAPKILELAETGLKCKIALSLHSCFDDIRTKIMPINKKYSLKENLDAVAFYANKTGTRITFEYIMLKGINDRIEDVKALVSLAKKIPSKVNIIPFNSLEHMNPSGFASELQPTSKSKIDEFVDRLRDNNVTVLIRDTQGEDIAAACGQLAIKY